MKTMSAEEYLLDIGLDNAIDEEFFNHDDKSWYKVQELMESYHQYKLENNGVSADVIDSFHCSTHDCGISRGRKCFKEKCEDWSGR